MQALSEGGERLALFRGVTGNPPRYDIITVKSDRREIRVVIGDSLSDNVRPQLFGRPSWSPDGERLAFTAQLDENGFQTDVYSVDADGSNPRRLTDDGVSGDPVWSPDGKTIVFSRWSTKDSERVPVASSLWMMDADGSGQRQLTAPEDGIFASPGSFAPDGSLLAFTRGSRAERSTGIYLIAPDGSGVGELASDAADPAFSPDGTRIAFDSVRDHHGRLCYGDACSPAGELYVMDADGSDQERLTETTRNEVNPAWSADGARIAYQRGEVIGNAEGTGAFAMNPDGSCPTPIAFDPHLDTWYATPEWEPGKGTGSLPC